MPLDNTMLAHIGKPPMIRLSPKTWRARLAAAAELRRRKAEIDKSAREIDKIWKDERDAIRDAIGPSSGAVCDDVVVTLKTTAASVPTLTLADGRVVKWSDVSAVIAGREKIQASEIKSVYGGRGESIDVIFAGC